MEIESRKVSDSIVETVHMVRPQHLNASDRLFGGALMQWIDEVAGMVAKRHTLDKNDKPVRVPRLDLETEEEKEEWEKGEKRRELRMMRKEEGL